MYTHTHTHTHTHTLTHTHTHTHTHSLPHSPFVRVCVCARARASVCVCHCVRLLVSPTAQERATARGRTEQQPRGCPGAVGPRGRRECARQGESETEHMCVHIM